LFIFTWKGRKIKSEIKNVFIADLAIIMLCEVHIFIEISISVRNLFSKTTYNEIWSGALKLYNYQNNLSWRRELHESESLTLYTPL